MVCVSKHNVESRHTYVFLGTLETLSMANVSIPIHSKKGFLLSSSIYF